MNYATLDKWPLIRIAYHEAGHAVVNFLCHIRFKYVAVYRHGKSGVRIWESPSDSEQWLSKSDLIVTNLAGLVAESIRFRRSVDHCLFDNLHEQERAKKYFYNNLDMGFWLDSTKAILTVTPIWHAVKKLAHELMIHRKISYTEATRIIKDTIQKYGGSMGEEWYHMGTKKEAMEKGHRLLNP